ncbi:MAG: sigma-54 dependent transcriptional regulator [Planctomycetota bacterium]
MSRNQVILVVDDEPAICWTLEKMLLGEGHKVVTSSNAEEGLQLARKHTPAMVFLDVRLPNEDGISALPKFLEASGGAPVVIMTAFGDLETAVAAVKHGASDYLTKPFKLDDALRACRTALAKAPSQSSPTAAQPMRVDSAVLVGTSPAMQHVFRQIALVAESDLSVLITGETGTGKELVAAAIHRHSHRSREPYIAVAPVTLSPELVESELFGHVKGAFTGAAHDHAGLFERASKGTILLDEIGDLPLATQVKLLRVLEQGQYSRVGETNIRTADVRVIAATNSDLPISVASGAFREDLFHRLAGIQIHLPPLRERLDDVGPLCEHFLRSMDYAAPQIDSSVLTELHTRPWHGNVRELKNAVGHAAVVARGRSLTIHDFPDAKPGRDGASDVPEPSLEHLVSVWALDMLSKNDDPTRLHSEFLAAVEPSLFRKVLESTGGNRAKAAELLGIHRGTLRERLRAYGIDD